jgi:hypothetical protein
MAIGNINSNNNNVAQSPTAVQDKNIAAGAVPQDRRSEAPVPVSSNDTVQISERAKALLASEAQGNGGGIIPPGTITQTVDTDEASTLGNGGGIIPPGN